MKKIFILALLIIFTATPTVAVELDADYNNAIDINKGGTNATTINDARANLGLGSSDDVEFGSVSAGTPNSTEGAEVAIHEGMIESDTDTESVGISITHELLDETDGTEDVAVRIYRMEAGSLLMAHYLGPALTVAPSGAHAPAYGCIAIADRANWDPASKGSGGAYLVWWDGDSWEAIGDQAD